MKTDNCPKIKIFASLNFLKKDSQPVICEEKLFFPSQNGLNRKSKHFLRPHTLFNLGTLRLPFLLHIYGLETILINIGMILYPGILYSPKGNAVVDFVLHGPRLPNRTIPGTELKLALLTPGYKAMAGNVVKWACGTISICGTARRCF